MEIIEGAALRIRVRNPDRFTAIIPKSHYEGEIAPGIHEILVNWGYDESVVLKNMGVKLVPSPIGRTYTWPGMYTPMAHQKETAEFLTMHKRCFCFDEMGVGKRLALGTPVLTPTGWAAIETLSIGDAVIGRNGKPCRVMGTFRQDDRPLYRITFNDGCSIDADDEHLWSVQHVRNDILSKYPKTIDGPWRIKTTAEILAAGLRDKSGNLNWRIPMAQAIEHAELALPADPYLVGVTIGDGSWKYNSTWELCTDKEILQSLGIVKVRLHKTGTYTAYGSIKAPGLPPARAPEKRIPQEYLFASIAQRRALLAGLMDTDGYASAGGMVQYATASKGLADDVTALVQSLGGIALRSTKMEPQYTYKGKKLTGLPSYIVTIRLMDNPFRLTRKAVRWLQPTKYKPARIIRSIERIKNGPGVCIAVDAIDHLYVTKDYIVTHNTAAAAWAADYLMTIGQVKRVLIICPVSIMQAAWQQDLFKVLMHRTVGIAHGTKDKRVTVIDSDVEFVIINYDGVQIVEDEIKAGGFDLIIMDEGNAIKNSMAKRSKSIKGLIDADMRVWLMTGTPAAQSPEDAYGLAKLVSPERVPKFFGSWRDMVMQKINMYKWVPRARAKDIVHAALQPAIRHTKEECLDLPDMVFVDRMVPLTKQQEKYYKILKEQMLASAAGQEITAVNAAALLNKLLQVSCGAAYAEGGTVVEFDVKPRLDALADVIDESTNKVIIFAPFRHTIALLERDLAARGYTTASIHGDVSSGKRGEIFSAFQYQADPKVIIIQPQAAAHGVTLTEASTVVWFGPTTSLDTYLQANARAHRKGQKNKVTVVHLQGSAAEAKLYAALSVRGAAHIELLALYKSIMEI